MPTTIKGPAIFLPGVASTVPNWSLKCVYMAVPITFGK